MGIINSESSGDEMFRKLHFSENEESRGHDGEASSRTHAPRLCRLDLVQTAGQSKYELSSCHDCALTSVGMIGQYEGV